MIRRATCVLTIVLLAGLGPLAAQSPSLSSLEAAVQQGDVSAALQLANKFHKGDDVVQDYARAAVLVRMAAEAGVADAENRLGQYYFEGLGVAQSREDALIWLERAAQRGDPQYIVDYATALEASGKDEDLARAAVLYETAANAGHLEAMVSLGFLYQNGSGVPQDLPRAVALYQPAAEAGHPRALNNLGLLYARGDGVNQDYDLAVKLFAAAADAGLTEAMTNLGVMYENGLGVPHSEEKAAELYRLGGTESDAANNKLPTAVYDPRLAEVQTDPGALNALSKAADKGDPVAEFQFAWHLASSQTAPFEDLSTAARLFHSAATKGHAPAMANLGLMFLEGRGVPKDYVIGQTWLVLALSQGFTPAANLVKVSQNRMTAAQINDAQQRATMIWQSRNSTQSRQLLRE